MMQIRKSMKQLLPKAFHKSWIMANKPDILHVVEKGGRGSGKSSDIAIMLIQLIMRYPANAVCIRKIDNTLEQSVYEQLKWAIEIQGVGHLFHANKSPLKLTYLPRGNYIIFRGAKEPERIKSLKDAKFPFAFCWIEELAEFKTEEDVTTITNSLLRGDLDDGLFYKFFYSYNPPKRKQSWVNKKYESVLQAANTYVHHSTYLDNPYVAKEFIKEAEETKKRNIKRFEWEYLGKAIGSGVVPFDNLVFRKITNEEVSYFDNIRQGNDFGYANDPNAFIRLHYDKKKRIIYMLDEIYEVKLSNRNLAKKLHEKDYHTLLTTCDSAEPKSIDDLRTEFHCRVEPAKKGAGSVEHGEKWLDDLEAIVIDPHRTPHAATEFENIDYQVDRDGNPKNRLEDKNNHLIDATRYALEQDMEQSRFESW
ncbi:phage terminase, large subunit, PBSX family [Granulicatella balaenopterae]|uniref:Phage terminase, large subunit, PBSX family n=2 Tax=Granulicatella balaenopterae TaxID=137733 RepID=A0A1H9IMX5_9LACT|nr:phage terminase, large subunit, PBSX family [Granulicatella balaenopterae]